MEEAKNAAITLPTYKDLNKFYVLNFDAGASPNLNWMGSNDDYIFKVQNAGRFQKNTYYFLA